MVLMRPPTGRGVKGTGLAANAAATRARSSIPSAEALLAGTGIFRKCSQVGFVGGDGTSKVPRPLLEVAQFQVGSGCPSIVNGDTPLHVHNGRIVIILPSGSESPQEIEVSNIGIFSQETGKQTPGFLVASPIEGQASVVEHCYLFFFEVTQFPGLG
jgi:hypothetical protein